MNDVPDHTDQRELLKRFIEEGRPATLEAIAEVVEGSGGSYYFRKTSRRSSRSNSAPTAACPHDWSR